MPNRENDRQLPLVARDTENSEPLPASNQPRQPRNFQDLLRYSTEATSRFGETAASNSFAPLDEESKKFLEEALRSMTCDVAGELLKCIKILQNVNAATEDEDPEEYEVALDQILEFVDNLDIANDFHKIGGFCIMKQCLESRHSTVRWRAAELVAELCQNNPYCQCKVLESDLLPLLIKMIDSDEDDTAKIKGLYAVSCLVRENEVGLKDFVSRDGLSVMLRALQSDLARLHVKSAFLLTSVCNLKPDVKDDLIKMGYVEQLISLMMTHIEGSREGHPPALEHLLFALLAVVKDNVSGQEIARRPELKFKLLLDNILKNSEGVDQYREENFASGELIKVIFGQSEYSDAER